MTTIEEIHLSFVNGQGKQAVQQIKEYGEYDFFGDYNTYLIDLYTRIESVHEYLINAINIYQRVNHR